jgi:glycosyltransferase involved in cell wall biosynthesis
MTKPIQNILYVISSAGIAGTELQVLETANKIKALGYKTSIWVLAKTGPLNELSNSLNVDILNFNIDLKRSPFTSLINLFKMGLRLRKNSPDVIHAFLEEAILLVLPLSYFFTPKTKRIAGIRGSTPDKIHRIKYFYRIILNSSWRIICNAKHLAKELEVDFEVNPEKICVIQNGVSRFASSVKTKNDIPNIIVIANLHASKGHFRLLQTLAKIEEDFRVFLCGTGDLRDEILTMIDSLNLNGKVVINSTRNNVKECLNIADFAIHPSESEGLSNAILEELSAGLPVIAFKIGGNSELITSGENGFLIESFSEYELKIGIEKLLKSESLREEMSTAALESSKRFTWEVHNMKLLTIYEETN